MDMGVPLFFLAFFVGLGLCAFCKSYETIKENKERNIKNFREYSNQISDFKVTNFHIVDDTFALVIDDDKHVSYFVYKYKNDENIDAVNGIRLANFAPQKFVLDCAKSISFFKKSSCLAIAIDSSRKKFGIVTTPLIKDNSDVNKKCRCDSAKFHLHSFKDVLKIDIIEHKKEQSKTVVNTDTDTKGGLSRAAAGGVLFGGAGAVVGAITAGKKSKAVSRTTYSSSSYYEFRVIINDLEGVYYSLLVNDVDTALLLDGIFSSALQNENESSENSLKQEVIPQSSVADEIFKLNNLKNSGAITQEEFIQLKGNLIKTS